MRRRPEPLQAAARRFLLEREDHWVRGFCYTETDERIAAERFLDAVADAYGHRLTLALWRWLNRMGLQWPSYPYTQWYISLLRHVARGYWQATGPRRRAAGQHQPRLPRPFRRLLGKRSKSDKRGARLRIRARLLGEVDRRMLDVDGVLGVDTFEELARQLAVSVELARWNHRGYRVLRRVGRVNGEAGLVRLAAWAEASWAGSQRYDPERFRVPDEVRRRARKQWPARFSLRQRRARMGRGSVVSDQAKEHPEHAEKKV